ncbi:TadE family type IV pilus minor pilin [Compostimonas suwonensis]|uniref:TadE-like protein n=1 Tax=Compostimonas suwonensis TaxID=1048394 RepID=A0A2M9BBW7_9MICO|nr:TadE family type IV pilus minor pilin [Compostimonas suwonensis]PJJ55436.1 hypothetical protein CLV54_2780 [Compostimonas suwonensis]
MTAEFAAVVPAIVLVLAFCLGGIQLATQNLRMTDAAADAARSLARGDGSDVAAGRAATIAGAVTMNTRQQGEFVCVELSAGSAFGPLALVGVEARAQSCALAGGL